MISFPPGPLLVRADGRPTVFPALGVYIQLEPTIPEDEERYAAAIGQIKSWVGERLRWTLTTTFACPEQFRPTDFDYVLDHARAAKPPPPVADKAVSDIALRHHVKTRLDFSMICHAAPEAIDGSPFTFAFHAEVPDDKSALSLRLPTCLVVTVPTDWPLEDFRTRVVALVTSLRVGWASAGLTYSGWEEDWFDAMHGLTYAHARRHPGFDIGEYAEHGNAFVNYVRTVNWLTFIGPALASRIPAPVATDRVPIERLGDVLLFQAGPEPRAGNINRLEIPEEYRQVDAMIRPVRAPDPKISVDFCLPWSERSTAEWLRRFERLPF